MASNPHALPRPAAPRTASAIIGAARTYVVELGQRAFQRRDDRPTHSRDGVCSGGKRRLLVLGDSTAVGLGAESLEDSIVGRLARAFPWVSVESRAECGARAACVVEQVRAVNDRYDAILIVAGGNDVIRGTPAAELESHLSTAVALARTRADVVVVANSINVGGAPMFTWPLNAVLTRRSMSARKIFAKVCARQRVDFVNLTFELESDPFVQQKDRYYAPDGLHPTGAAYGWCFNALIRQSRLARQLHEPLAGATSQLLPS